MSEKRAAALSSFWAGSPEWAHHAPSAITQIVPAGRFLLVVTECHGSYFLNERGDKVLLPICTKPKPDGA